MAAKIPQEAYILAQIYNLGISVKYTSDPWKKVLGLVIGLAIPTLLFLLISALTKSLFLVVIVLALDLALLKQITIQHEVSSGR